MSRVDSGNESQEGSPDTTVSEPPFPPRFSAALTQTKTVIRPVAFKPSALSSSRFSNSGHRYGSTPILARPASHLALYGSSGELWRGGGGGGGGGGGSSAGCGDRKVVSPPPAMSSLPSDCSRLHSYDSLDSVYKSATHTNSNRKVVSPPAQLTSADSSQLHLSLNSSSQASVDEKLDGYSSDDGRKPPTPQPAPPSDASRHNFFTSIDSSFKPVPHSKLQRRRVQSPPPSLPSDDARLVYYGSIDSGYKSSNSSVSRLLRRAPPLSSLAQGFGRLQSFSSLDSVCTITSNPKSSRGASCELSPSPCDSSTLAELEVALRERDSELLYLRQTMETNEQVIFRVYEEKERAWERELRRVRAAAEERLRAASQRASKTERTLITHTYQLQQEKKRLREELERTKEENGSLRSEIDALRSRLEETEWSLCQKSGELALVKAKLKEAQNEQATKTQETLALRNELRESRALLEERTVELSKLRAQVDKLSDKIEDDEPSKENLIIQQDVEEDDKKADTVELLRQTLAKERAEWEAEREVWASEKERVLAYQKQLQVNYVAMYRRTRELEKARSLMPEITSGVQL